MAGKSLNKVTLIGHLGGDPEIRFTKSGLQVASFSVATNERWKDADNNWQDRTEWHNIIAWTKLAEICGQYLKKGAKIYVEGRLQTSNWDDNNGVKHYKTEIIMSDMIMLDGKRGDDAPASQGSYSSGAPSAEPPPPDNDLPF
jgi:single-strand DNA-binding protein